MEIKHLIKAIICFLPIFSFGQECNSCSKFYYKYTYQKDSLDTSVRSEDFFVLIKKNDSIIFSDVSNIKADSVEAKVWADFSSKKSSSISFAHVPKTRFRYYIQKIQNNIFVLDKIGTGNYIYEDTTNFDWKLSDEKKMIAGFQCQKATTSAFGRNFTAWFTSEIPIHDGPYKFRGLPGLIIEIYDHQKYFIFSLVKYNKNEKVDIKIPAFRKRRLITTSKEKFVAAKKNYREGIVSRIKNSSISENVSQDRIKQIQNDLIKNNNQIERQP